jgi:tetratricopeptide (TPR) repeat protein
MKVIVGGPITELYDLGSDPGENHELGEVDPASRLRGVIDEMTGGETRIDILASLRSDPDPDRKELLESLGYLGGTDSGEGSASRFPHPTTALPEWRKFQESKALYRKAVTLAVGGSYDAAIVLFDSVLAGSPRADVFFNRGMARRKNGDESGFREDLKSSLAMDGNYISALSMQASLDHQAGRTDQALAGWKKIHQLDSRNVPTLKALGQWYAERKDWERALPYIRSLVNELPRDPTHRYNLGVAASEAGNYSEARSAFEIFLRVAPGDPRATDVRQILTELEG